MLIGVRNINYLKEVVYPNASPSVVMFCDSVLESRNINSSRISDVTYLGVEQDCDDSEIVLGDNLSHSVVVYHRIVKRKVSIFLLFIAKQEIKQLLCSTR